MSNPYPPGTLAARMWELREAWREFAYALKSEFRRLERRLADTLANRPGRGRVK